MKVFKSLKFSKGQSVIVQFTLFFLIGITLFIGLGNFFRIQSEILRQDLVDLSLDMIGSYMSSMAVSMVEGCKDCGVIESNIKLDRTYVGYFVEVKLNDSGLSIETAPQRSDYLSSINNLNESLNITDGSAPSIRPINLTYNKNQNKLEIR